jgi:nucleoside phosphorylase
MGESPGTSQPTPGDPVIALIVPTHHESRAVLKALPGAQPASGWNVPAWRLGSLLVVEPGMGPDRAASVLPCLEGQCPAALWLFGCCGGLSSELGVGDLVLANATVRHDAPETCIRHPPPDALRAQVRCLAKELGLRLVVGPVLTSSRVLASAADKRAGAATGAAAVEMEADPLSRWAAERSVPFVHLRVVLDPAIFALPEAHLPVSERGSVPATVLVLHVLTHPRQWPALWRLMRQVRATGRTMTRIIAALTGPGGALKTTDQRE